MPRSDTVVPTIAILLALLSGCVNPLADSLGISMNAVSGEFEEGAKIEFRAHGAGGDRVTWEFGDGSEAIGAEVIHIYNRGGSYVVTAHAGGQEATIRVGISSVDEVSGTAPARFPVTGSGDQASTHKVEISDRNRGVEAQVHHRDETLTTSLQVRLVNPDGGTVEQSGGDPPIHLSNMTSLPPGLYRLEVWADQGGRGIQYNGTITTHYEGR